MRNWECPRPCAQSGRQFKNASTESWDLMWNWHSLTDCTHNNLSWSPAQLCQTTSRTAAVWNQSRYPSWLAASSCCKRYGLTSYALGMKVVYRRTTIQLAERSGLWTSRYQKATHRSHLLRTCLTFSRSVMVSVAVSTMGMTELIFFELTIGWRWTASIMRCLAMTPRRTTDYAKNYCNRNCRKCSHMFFMGHSVQTVCVCAICLYLGHSNTRTIIRNPVQNFLHAFTFIFVISTAQQWKCELV